jgi:hypothetical protein
MKEFIRFPDIQQFREIVKKVKNQTWYQGKDDDDNIIYDRSIPLPVLEAEASVKLHGSNAGVCFNEIDGLWNQSRTSIISVDNDNAGFSFFVESKKEVFERLFKQVIEKYNIDATKNSIAIFGEWCGKGIQKKVAICELDKMFVIFGLKIRPFDEKRKSYWLEEDFLKSEENRIFNINDFPKFKMEIDFGDFGGSKERIYKLVDEVEKECPFAKQFNVSGIGEGVVFKIKNGTSRMLFKAKGDKHSGKSGPKVPKKVDNEKIQKINELAMVVLPAWRLEQMYNETFDILNGGEADVKGTGNFLKNVIKDVHKEEIETFVEFGIEPKEANSTISKIAREWFFEQLDKDV